MFDTFLVRAATVAVAMIVVDVAWARYIQTVSGGKRLAAAAWAAGLYLLGAFVVTQYTHDWRLLLPAALGSFVGTYVGTSRAA